MNLFVGTAATLFAIVTLVMRWLKPQSLVKLQNMKARFGDGRGNIAHLTMYALIPLAIGVYSIFSWLALATSVDDAVPIPRPMRDSELRAESVASETR